MSDVKALGEIQRLARLDRIVVTRHAAVRMDQRGAKRGDVRAALVSATSAVAQDGGRWRVAGGHDRDGDDLAVIVDLEADVIVVTLF